MSNQVNRAPIDFYQNTLSLAGTPLPIHPDPALTYAAAANYWYKNHVVVLKNIYVDCSASSEAVVGSRLFSEYAVGTNTNYADKYFMVPAGKTLHLSGLNLILPMASVTSVGMVPNTGVIQLQGSPQGAYAWAHYHLYPATWGGLTGALAKGMVDTTTDTAGEYGTLMQVAAGRTFEINRVYMWGECTTTRLYYSTSEVVPASGTTIIDVDADDSWTGTDSFRDRIDLTDLAIRVSGGNYIQAGGFGATAGDFNVYIEGHYID